MNLEKRAVELCERLGFEEANKVQIRFLHLYSNKYFKPMMEGKINHKVYIDRMDRCLEKYIGLYMVRDKYE